MTDAGWKDKPDEPGLWWLRSPHGTASLEKVYNGGDGLYAFRDGGRDPPVVLFEGYQWKRLTETPDTPVVPVLSDDDRARIEQAINVYAADWRPTEERYQAWDTLKSYLDRWQGKETKP